MASDNQLIVDGSFLHYLASRFDTSAVNADGEAYLEDWKLEVAADQQSVHASPMSDGCAVVAPADRATGWLLLLPAAALLLLRRRVRLRPRPDEPSRSAADASTNWGAAAMNDDISPRGSRTSTAPRTSRCSRVA